MRSRPARATKQPVSKEKRKENDPVHLPQCLERLILCGTAVSLPKLDEREEGNSHRAEANLNTHGLTGELCDLQSGRRELLL